MMYSNRFIAAIKVGGKVLRENSNVVTIPFGSEYSILLKNLNSVRSQVKVSVDGKDATEGTWLIIPANGSLELERYIRNGNFERGNRFKFIQRTKGIEDHRGIGSDDGLVRVEYKMERVVVDQPVVRHHYYDEWHPVPRPYYYPRPWWPYTYPYPYWQGTFCNSGLEGSNSLGQAQTGTFNSGNVNSANVGAMNSSVQPCSAPSRLPSSPMRSMRYRVGGSGSRSIPGSDSARMVKMSFASQETDDNGITVAGSESDQKFVTGAWFATESHSDVIVLKLRGEIAGKVVVKAVTVNHKPKCETCGKSNKGTASFCSDCGTALLTL